MAADSEESARKVPLIAALPKMFFPFLVILPGLIAVSVVPAAMHHAATAQTQTVGAVGMGAVGANGVPVSKGLIPMKVDIQGPKTGLVDVPMNFTITASNPGRGDRGGPS